MSTPVGEHNAPDPAEHLPPEWDDLDHAIYDARIRRRLPWRDVATEVGLASFSSCRARFYRRMAAVVPAEVAEMRAEENAKLDDREQRARTVYGAAMAGTLLRYQGQVVYMVDEAGERHAVIERDLGAAAAALRVEDQIARARYRLNGLEAPVKLDVTGLDPADEVERAIAAYTQGLVDADARDRTSS